MGLRISIYNDPPGSGIGGSELVAAQLAELLAVDHHVDLFHRIPSLNLEQFARNSGTNLSGVRLKYIESNGVPPQVSRNPRQHYQHSRDWLAKLSDSYDLFVAIVHGVPPFCHAEKGALIVLFPTPTAPYVTPQGRAATAEAIRNPASWLYQQWEWRKRMSTYQVKTAISDFTRQWTKRRWGIDCEIVHPPVNTRFRPADKVQKILSVGRFAIKADGHSKNQPEMLETFRRMEADGLTGWQYFSVGGLANTPQHRAYFSDLSQTAGDNAKLIPNIARDDLNELYEQSAIFWHAAGFGEDDSVNPIFVEHFGISTVEAMAAGCVPVVINKGGQREIVQHGVNGFHWDTLEELKHYTEILTKDANLRRTMSEAARARASVFSRDAFAQNFVAPLVGAVPDYSRKSGGSASEHG